MKERIQQVSFELEEGRRIGRVVLLRVEMSEDAEQPGVRSTFRCRIYPDGEIRSFAESRKGRISKYTTNIGWSSLSLAAFKKEFGNENLWSNILICADALLKVTH